MHKAHRLSGLVVCSVIDNATCSRGLCTVLYWTPKWHLSCIFYKWLFLGGVQRTFPAVSVKSEQGMEFRLIIHYGSSPTRRWTGMRRSLHHFDGYWEDHWLTADRTHGTRAAVDRLTFELVFSGPALHTWRPGAKRQREGARRLGQWESAARFWMSEGTKAMVDRLTCELVLSGTECDSIHDEQEQSDSERAIEEHHSVKEVTGRFWMSDFDGSVFR
ncbi:uncharacterized protein [Dermacentor albipictus]|uniref:uncharacterized protein isoform X3 n=1 Tax=Dermacentor albipictus TaxID=60249 RepID=UPI0038FD1475